MWLRILIKQIAAKSYGFLRELWWYTKHLFKGTSYAEYYADRMNHIVTRNPDWGLNLDRRFQLDYLRKHGLTSSSSLLDYGCGALAAGIHFIRFLEPLRYMGIDISKEVLREGERRLVKEGLAGRQGGLYLLDDNLNAVLGPIQFDFVWAQSVLTHMPPDDIRRLLEQVRHHMHSESQLFITFAHDEGKPSQRNFKDWYYNQSFFIDAAVTYGFDVEFMADWKHPSDPGGNDTMARFTLKKGI